MKMKKDGHIKFYTSEEFTKIAQSAGMIKKDCFMTSIRFPKLRSTAEELPEIVKRNDKKVIEGYDLEIKEDEIFITEKVLNMTFQK